MTAESTNEMILADLLDVLCDFACDADQCLNPWPDETLAPLRALAGRLRRWHRPYSLDAYRPRPQTVTVAAPVFPKDTTITLTDASHLLPGDLLDFDGEIMGVMGRPIATTLGDGDLVAVARGLRGTVATGHPVGAVGLLIGNTRTGGESAAERLRLLDELAGRAEEA